MSLDPLPNEDNSISPDSLLLWNPYYWKDFLDLVYHFCEKIEKLLSAVVDEEELVSLIFKNSSVVCNFSEILLNYSFL